MPSLLPFSDDYFFELESHLVAQAGLELRVILLLQPPECAKIIGLSHYAWIHFFSLPILKHLSYMNSFLIAKLNV